MTSRAQIMLVRGRSHSENLTFSALLCEQMLNEKERQTTKQKKGTAIYLRSAYSFAAIKKIN